MRAEFIDFRMRIPHDMRVELVAYFRTHALGSLRCIALTDQRRAQPDHIEQHKYAAHFEHITLVAIFDANVDHLCHNNGNDELKIASMSLKKRAQKDLFLKSFKNLASLIMITSFFLFFLILLSIIPIFACNSNRAFCRKKNSKRFLKMGKAVLV